MGDYTYSLKHGAYIVWDGDLATARELKNKTDEPVLVYDPDKDRFYIYKIEYESRPLRIKHGEFVGRKTKDTY